MPIYLAYSRRFLYVYAHALVAGGKPCVEQVVVCKIDVSRPLLRPRKLGPTIDMRASVVHRMLAGMHP